MLPKVRMTNRKNAPPGTSLHRKQRICCYLPGPLSTKGGICPKHACSNSQSIRCVSR